MKIIKIESCKNCPNIKKYGCFILSLLSDKIRKITNPDVIHPDCPLDDYTDDCSDITYKATKKLGW